ncbi:MAG: pyridoxamine 5'-phosphate oxidase [Chloroflexi bacterium]|nr:pyridoxamine 5'-phosphate oxidase [Chloroflexota bacterium]
MLSRIQRFLEEHNTLSLATVDSEGVPFACSLFYTFGPDLTLYFLSDPKTAHAQHLKDGAAVAATIAHDNQEWQTLQGLQLRGVALPCSEPDEEEIARDLYNKRFPFIAKAEVLAGPLGRARYYKIVPTWIRLIDNRRGFGHKEEWRRNE